MTRIREEPTLRFWNRAFGLPVVSPISCPLFHSRHVQIVVPPTQDHSVVTTLDLPTQHGGAVYDALYI